MIFLEKPYEFYQYNSVHFEFLKKQCPILKRFQTLKIPHSISIDCMVKSLDFLGENDLRELNSFLNDPQGSYVCKQDRMNVFFENVEFGEVFRFLQVDFDVSKRLQEFCRNIICIKNRPSCLYESHKKSQLYVCCKMCNFKFFINMNEYDESFLLPVPIKSCSSLGHLKKCNNNKDKLVCCCFCFLEFFIRADDFDSKLFFAK